jgi:hypothetical protein
LDVGHHVKRSPEHRTAFLAVFTAVIDLTKRLPGRAAIPAEVVEFGRLQRKTVVRPASASIQREVFLDHASAQRDSCYGCRVIERVIGQARQDMMPDTDI